MSPRIPLIIIPFLIVWAPMGSIGNARPRSPLPAALIHAREDSANVVNTGPQVEGMQFDAVTTLFSGAASVFLDVNALEVVRTTDRISVGLRTGVSFIAKGDVGGSDPGSPWTDYHLLGRLTVQAPNLRITGLAGYTRSTTSDRWYSARHAGRFTYGGEAQWLFIAGTAGLIAAGRINDGGSSHGGLGLVLYFDFW